MHFYGAHLRCAHQRAGVLDRDERWMPRIDAGMLRHVRNRQLLAVLLEEQLPADIPGGPPERPWPVLQMRQYPRRDSFVVRHNVELANARGWIDHAIRMTDLDARDFDTGGLHLRRPSLRFIALR